MNLPPAGPLLVTALLVLGTAGPAAAVDQASSADSEVEPQVLDSCTTIREPGEYALAGDLERTDADPCLRIQASDVVLDGGGHVVAAGGGADGVGIAVGPGESGGALSNVTVRDVGVRGWDRGLEVSATEGATLRDVAATDGRVGVSLDNATDTELAGLALERNDDWSLYAAGGTRVAAERVSLGGTRVSFAAADVALAPADAPPAPRGFERLGGAFAATATEPDAWLAVELSYEPANLAAANASAETLVVARHADGRWTPAPDSAVDTGAAVVAANVTRFGTFAVLGQVGVPGPAPLPTADVAFDCDAVSVTVTPTSYDYYLVVFYRQRSTGATGKALVGPYRGTLETPFGPDLLVTRVEVVVSGRTIAGESIPDDC